MRKLTTNTPTATRKTMSKILNQVYSGTMDVKTGNCLLTGCNLILGAFKTCDFEQRIQEIEKMLDECGK